MNKFSATVEFLSDRPAAIVTLTDDNGEWSGGGIVELPRCPRAHLRASLYEAAYIDAGARAIGKGGRLERFSEV